MADSSSTVRLYRPVKQDQDIPIRIRLCISPSVRPVENNPCGWLDIVDCLANATQKSSVVISHGVLLQAPSVRISPYLAKRLRSLAKGRRWIPPVPMLLLLKICRGPEYSTKPVLATLQEKCSFWTGKRQVRYAQSFYTCIVHMVHGSHCRGSIRSAQFAGVTGGPMSVTIICGDRPVSVASAMAEGNNLWLSLDDLRATIGHRQDAQGYFAEAKRLHPENWSFKRQSWELEEPGKASGPEFWAVVETLEEKPYYPPVNL